MTGSDSERQQLAPARLKLAVLDITCGGGGALTVERALSRLADVRRVYVNALTEMAYVDYDPGVVTVEQLLAAVRRCGYRAVMATEAGDPARQPPSFRTGRTS